MSRLKMRESKDEAGSREKAEDFHPLGHSRCERVTNRGDTDPEFRQKKRSAVSGQPDGISLFLLKADG